MVILAVALAVRIAVIVATPHFAPIFDAADYDRLGASIAAGHGYPGQLQPATPSAFRPPLYPFVLAGVHLVGGGWTAERLVAALLGTIAVLLVFLIAVRIWGRTVGLTAAGLAAIFPPLFLMSATLLSESLFTPLVLAAVLAVLQYRDDPRVRWAALAGVLVGLAALTRSNGTLLVLAAAAGVWVGKPRQRRAALAAPAVVLVAALLTVTPWIARNAIDFGRWVGLTTQSGYAVAATYNADAARVDPPGHVRMTWTVPEFRSLYRRPMDEGRRSDKLVHSAIDFAKAHPGYVVKASAWNTLRVFELHRDDPIVPWYTGGLLQAVGERDLISPLIPLTVYAALILALIGAATQAGLGRARRGPGFVWAFPVLILLPAIVLYGQPRYRIPADPFLLILAALGLRFVVRTTRRVVGVILAR
jgi:4-amino-4-deoxy-L-arabinose transferase-like glycosyltransferase